MRVFFLTGEYPPTLGGGIGTFTRSLALELVCCGVDVSVVGVYPVSRREADQDCGVTVTRLPRTRLRLTRFVRNGLRIRRAVLAEHGRAPIDVVEGQENAYASVRLGTNGPKRVIRMHGGHHFFAVAAGRKPAAWRGWQERRSFDEADSICAVSRYVAETTRDLLRLGRREITILPNFVDTAKFSPAPVTLEEEGLIVFVGTVCRKKGVKELVEAMPAILSESPNARLLIVGRDQAEEAVGGSFTEYLRRSVVRPEVANRVEFLGPVSNETLPALLARAAVCVYPSHMEAMPMAWLEAMACGKAVVASRLGPGPEVVDDGVSGFLCDPKQPEDIADRVVRCLRNEGLRRSLGAQARRRVVENFSADVMVPKNLEFYRRVAGLS